MCDNQFKIFSGLTTGSTCTQTIYTPPCYTPVDPCENCGYKDSCTKKNKALPYYPYWQVTPISILHTL